MAPSELPEFRFADRMQNLRASAIRELFDEGRRRPHCVDLSIGQADFEVPEPIREASIRGIREGCGRYSSSQGYPELVEATHRHLVEHFDLPEGDRVMLTSGASGALTLALLALTGPGDEVLMPDPFVVLYRNLAHITGATPTFYDLYPDFRLHPERIEAAITDRTRVLILNSPANPTGVCFRDDEVAAVAEICRERGIVVVSDELYGLFLYEGEHAGIKRHMGAHALLVGGVSKTYGMAGWRLGWVAGDPALIEKLLVLQQFTFTCASTPAQHGALQAFGVDMSHQVERYRRKRDLLYEGLIDAGYRVSKPTGSFYIFPEVPFGDDLSFTRAALERDLLVVPGRAFSQHTTHFRLSFAAKDEDLRRALEILGRLTR